MTEARSTWEAILDDRSLSREARLMAMHLLRLGPGEHEVSTEDWQRVLGKSSRGFPKRQSIAMHAQELELAGWIGRRPGGAGSPRYALQSPQGMVGDSTVPSGDASLQSPQGTAQPLQSPQGTSYSPPRGRQEAPSSSTGGSTSSGAHAREDVEISDLHPMAARVLTSEAETLGKAGPALRDYLVLRVRPEFQYGYARSTVGSLTGMDEVMWRDKTGATLHDDRDEVLRQVFNDLLACDETGPYFKHEPGEFGNVRSKVAYVVNRRLGAERTAKKRREAGPSDRPDRTAAEEQADLERKREAARARSAAAETAAQERTWADHRTAVLEAKAWLDEQDEDTVARINRKIELASSGVPQAARTRAFVEATLVAAVKEERSRSGTSARHVRSLPERKAIA